jgi:transcriptional regulator with XRE-family HTH domain
VTGLDLLTETSAFRNTYGCCWVDNQHNLYFVTKPPCVLLPETDFGDRLRELRHQKGLNQRELADKVDIDFTYLSKIETGKMSPPSQDTIRKLAEVLDADLDELLVLAGRVPDDVKEVVTQSREHPAFLREIKDLGEEELEELRQKAKEIREKRGQKSSSDSN